MHRTFTLVVFLAGQSLISAGQDFRRQFSELCSRRDTIAEEKLLAEWRAARPHDPELYVAYYDFYVQKSMTELLHVDRNAPPGKEALQLNRMDSATNQPAGFLYSQIYYKPEVLQKAFAYVDTAIERNPDRLDMRFGKIYMLGEAKDYKEFTAEIVRTVERSAKNGNIWLWTDDVKKEQPKDFLLSTIQGYQFLLYNTGDDALMDNMQEIAMAVLKHYPDHVESPSDLSIRYIVKGDFKSALTPLLKAERLAPHDAIVLNNIAHCYMQTGDRENAIRYYKLTQKYGRGDVQESARRKLAELGK